MKYFLYFPLILSFTSHAIAAKDCKKQTVSFEKEGFKVQTLKYESRQPSTKTILVLPPTGGTNILDRSYAEMLCEQNFNVYVLEHWTDEHEYSLDLRIHKRFYQRSLMAIEAILHNTQSSFVGILGTSVGAIHAAIAANHFEKIQAAFLITGGAPISEVIAHSDQEVLAKARHQRFSSMGFKSKSEYINALDEVLPMDPFNMPRIAPWKKLGMVIAPDDTTVPGANQKALRDLWKPQWTLELSGSHRTAIIKTWLLHRKNVVEFFKRAAF